MGRISKISRSLSFLRGLLYVVLAALVALVVVWPLLELTGAGDSSWQGALRFSRPEQTPVAPVKIMPLGDSITEGSTTVVKNGYRLALLKKLPESAVDYVGTYEYGLPNLGDQDTQGEGGACIRAKPCNSTSMFEKTAGWIKQAQPDIVILNGGTNDYCCGRESQDDAVVQSSMRDWIQRIWETKPSISIVVIGMPDDHQGLKDWIEQYVAEQGELGKEIHYVSLDGVDTYDTVHPNLAGYDTLAERLAKVIRPIIDERVN